MSHERTGSFKRSPVTKILIAELVRTTHALPKAEEQYATQTYLSPTGRSLSKIMISGTAVEKEDIGKDSSHWRLRVSDPSGTIQIYAGMYQTEAAAVIAQIEIPCFVSVVGKPHIFEPESGSHIVSIRPESVTIISGKTRDDFVLDAALSTIRSIRKTTDEKMKEIAVIYGEKEGKEAYMCVAQQAMESLLPDHIGCDIKTNNEKPGDEIKQDTKQCQSDLHPEKTDTDKLIDNSIKTIQEVLLEILNEKGTVKYEDIPDMLKDRGINPNMVDWTSAVKRLMNEGQCFEPRAGILRVTT